MTQLSCRTPSSERLDRIEAAICAQKAFISRVPDPDNRSRAEKNLLALLEMKEHAGSADIAAIEVQ